MLTRTGRSMAWRDSSRRAAFSLRSPRNQVARATAREASLPVTKLAKVMANEASHLDVAKEPKEELIVDASFTVLQAIGKTSARRNLPLLAVSVAKSLLARRQDLHAARLQLHQLEARRFAIFTNRGNEHRKSA